MKEAKIPEEPKVILKTDPDEYARRFFPEEPPVEEEILEEEEVASLEEVYAGGFWVRSLALAVDLAFLCLLVGLFFVLGLLAMEMSLADVRNLSLAQKLKIVLPVLFPWGGILGIGYFTYFLGAWGQTLGKMIFSLRVIQKDGEPISFGRAFFRTLAYSVSLIPIFMGFFWVAFAPSKRGWHDVLAGSIVIKD